MTPTFDLPRRRSPVALLALALLSTAAGAQVYVGTSASGAVVLSNHATDVADTVLIAAEPAPARPSAAIPASRAIPTVPPHAAAPDGLVDEIRSAAQRHALPEALLTAVIAVESGFDARAVSPKGAMGLMQLMPATARRFGVRDPFSTVENLAGGAAYLRHLIDLFDDLTLALAAYNAGEGAVLRAGRQVPAYRETRDYVRKVLTRVSQATPPAATF